MGMFGFNNADAVMFGITLLGSHSRHILALNGNTLSRTLIVIP